MQHYQYTAFKFFDEESASYHISHAVHAPVGLRLRSFANNEIVPGSAVIVIDYYPNSEFLFITTDFMFRSARVKVQDWVTVAPVLRGVILWSLKYAQFNDLTTRDSLTQAIIDLLSCQQN